MQVFLETPRLVLRRFTHADMDNLVSLNPDPDVMRFLTGGIPTGRDEIENELLPAFLGYYERSDGYGLLGSDREADRGIPGVFLPHAATRRCTR
jgi:RimJ/RimL family protein N-acetyltransferase